MLAFGGPTSTHLRAPRRDSVRSLEPTLTSPRAIDEGRSASYRMEALDAQHELGRLKAQVELVRPIEDGFLDSAGLAPDVTMLDLGCGPGFFAERVARERLGPEGRIIGVDVDGELVRLGSERLADSGLPIELRLGTAVRIPLDDDSVDFAYARFLFQHLEDPAGVLAEMVRVTRPGGVVAVVDTDDGGLVVHPEPDGFAELLAASFAAQRDRGGDRHVGRKLRAMIAAAGLEDPDVEVRPLTTADLSPRQFVAITIGFKAGVLGPPHMTRERARDIQACIEEVAAAPDFFGHALGYGAWGRVPAA